MDRRGAAEGDEIDVHEACASSWPLCLKMLPPGFRFQPSDDELLGFYLHRRMLGLKVPSHLIADVVDLYKHDPWDLPSLSPLSPSSKDSQWFFFNFSYRKYPKGPRTNRATLSGYWKATGRDRSLPSAHHLPAPQLSAHPPESRAATTQSSESPAHDFSGIKKTLVFYQGRAPHGKRTSWVMHEFHLLCSSSSSSSSSSSPPSRSSPLSNSNIVLCRIVNKNSNPAQPSDILANDSESDQDHEESIHA